MLDVHAVFQADKAIEKMEEILADYPDAANLAREVGTFFGPNFYLKGTTELHSGFVIACEKVWKPETEPVEIRLVCSVRSQSALVHELLHGKLLIQGYPWSWSYEQQIGHDRFPNLVYHELMVSQYRACGLPCAEFTGQFDSPQPYRENEATKLETCWEWLTSWLDGRYTGIQTKIEAAEQIRVEHSLYENTFRDIEARFLAICQVAPENFEDAYDELSRSMGLGEIGRNQWFRVKAGAPYPIVVPNVLTALQVTGVQ
jgi:hypothetical protein